MDSFISWIGGKRQLRKQIIAMFPEKYERYIEVFGGAGWVLFGLDKPAKLEVYNDLDGELVNLYRCVKYHAQALQEELRGYIYSRELFKDFLQQMQVQGLTDIQRAARYYVLIHSSFGAKKKHFTAGKSSNHKNKVKLLSVISERLGRTVIENRDFEALIDSYDKPDALFYVDPPYYGTEKHYDVLFKQTDHIRLHNMLAGIKGKFILSYNDDDFIRDLYRDYNITAVTRANNLSTDGYGELIITNY